MSWLIFFLADIKCPTPKVKQRKLILAQFVEVLAPGQLTSRQTSMRVDITGKKESIARQAVKKQATTSLPLPFLPFDLSLVLVGATHIQGGFSHYPHS